MSSSSNYTLFLLIILIVAASVSPVTPRHAPENTDEAMHQRFERYIMDFGRRYEGESEKSMRFELFRSNVEYIESFNRNATNKFKLGINQFTDLSSEEIGRMIGDVKLPEGMSEQEGTATDLHFGYEQSNDVPEKVDWRESGAVTPVKNQGSTCGSCTPFAVVATVESLVKIKTGNLVSLSEQNLMDCVPGDSCAGQLAMYAYDFIITNGGLVADSTYPYAGVDHDVCDKSKTSPIAASIKAYVRIPPMDENAIMLVVASQPVYVAIDAGSPEFMQFSGDGVFNGVCGTRKHAVAVIGYGTEADGTKYWLVKNSWGTSWGNGGYGKIARGVNGRLGMCTIAGDPYYPTM